MFPTEAHSGFCSLCPLGTDVRDSPSAPAPVKQGSRREGSSPPRPKEQQSPRGLGRGHGVSLSKRAGRPRACSVLENTPVSTLPEPRTQNPEAYKLRPLAREGKSSGLGSI